MAEIAIGSRFEYGGIHSEELGLSIVRDGGPNQRFFGVNRDVKTETIRGMPTPYHFENETEVIRGSMQIFSSIPWTLPHERDVSRFLYRDTFQEFISEDNPDLVYNLMFIGDHTETTGFRKRGWIEVNFVCDAPWPRSKPLTNVFYLTSEELKQGFVFEINNLSNQTDYNALEMELTMDDGFPSSSSSSAAYTIRNLRNQEADEGLTVGGSASHPLHSGETIYIRMHDGAVLSDRDDFRHTTVHHTRMVLEYGKNNLMIKGDGVDNPPPVKLVTRCRFPIIR